MQEKFSRKIRGPAHFQKHTRKVQSILGAWRPMTQAEKTVQEVSIRSGVRMQRGGAPESRV